MMHPCPINVLATALVPVFVDLSADFRGFDWSQSFDYIYSLVYILVYIASPGLK